MNSLPRLERDAEGVLLSVRATPGASKDEVAGTHGDALKVKVTASPERGKANRAVLAVIAKSLSLPRSRVVLRSGKASRQKTVIILGADLDDVRSRLRQSLAVE